LLERVVLRRLAQRDSGVVDEDVESPECVDRARDERAAVVLAGDVDLDADRTGAERGELGHRGLVLARVAAGDDDAGAGTREPARHAQADPAVAAGDDRHAAGQIEWIHCSTFLRETPRCSSSTSGSRDSCSGVPSNTKRPEASTYR